MATSFLNLSKQFSKLVKKTTTNLKVESKCGKMFFKNISQIFIFFEKKQEYCDKMVPLYFYFSYFDIISHQTKRWLTRPWNIRLKKMTKHRLQLENQLKLSKCYFCDFLWLVTRSWISINGHYYGLH
jgi:hypothetical protein